MRPLVLQASFGTADTLWWLWLLIAASFLGIIVYLVGRIGPGGPWARH